MLPAWNAYPMLDRLLNDVMSGVAGTALGTSTSKHTYSPAIDVRANADEVVFVCDVPGLKHEDLDVTVTSNRLTIKGQRRYEGNEKDRVWLGRSYGAFEKTFTLPDFVDAENMTADLSDGVLTIKVPKQPQAKPRRVLIGGGNGQRQLGQKSE